ncbi:hypothetical protein GCK72_009237 [Caenorhabditis remanei]|uniref:SPK domain-containing protein n=1 Tax=Caenorhabditis remanei TaxID=31234 RepID=A0A6A5H2H0_CAERE|nr:hypothetical protein GCK72_009237 [Caenorhabditis remanei]KAF1760984.1 hypothetical protein GCK72_009237 [Caenorhabditis remanei]
MGSFLKSDDVKDFSISLDSEKIEDSKRVVRFWIDPRYKKLLQHQATVKIDNHQRIVEYETIGGGLKLSGKHFPIKPKTDRKNRIMMMFLARKTETVDYPLSPTIFIDEYRAICATSEARFTAQRRYRGLKDKIYWATEYDKVTRMKMMFISGGKVPECFLRELREDALVDVDEENRIILYQSIDGSLNLQGDHSLSTKMMMVAAYRNSLDIAQLESNEESVEIEERNEKEETIVDMSSMKRNGRLTKYDVEWWPSMKKRNMGDLDYSLPINDAETSANVIYEEDPMTAITKKRIKEEHNYAAFNNQYIETIPVRESIPPNYNSKLIEEIKNESENDVEWCPSMRKRNMGDLDYSLSNNDAETSAIRNDVMYEEDSKRIKEEHEYTEFNNQYIDTIPVREFIPPNHNSDLIDEVKHEYD